MSVEKKPNHSSEFEVDSTHNSQHSHLHENDAHLNAKRRNLRALDTARAAATLLALLMGLAVLGTTGHALQAYNSSSPRDAAWLSVWPNAGAFDVKPTVALVAGASLVVLANLIALTSHHRFVRAKLANAHAHTPLTFSAPFVGLVAAIVAVILFYVANRSATADTLLSWSCRWRHLATAHPAPQFASLCRASHAGVDLAILLIPVEFLALALAGVQLKIERYTTAYAHARKTPSPVLS
ncbi:uncharacterized protein SPSK_07860 [Sporothrix schenckii 1099-18]|uniref:Uncharacterized protein n=2 Tax=Sporothrix schenckii TaxID=29908 RepID=U7Q4I7_SPOS1|nr:uncharacterized protein SPSK_07860 [Sporothrix schenckii 1099-18]ERT01626.1 hypothetical protein HMPREF1624_02877 [Sporothrix schenckii ATCC 58251]KJR88854.1 hypothetical protein SPSK_07860 [Sporothrix schenckii 1099-18]